MMGHLKAGALFVLLSSLTACGNQLVEFPLDGGSSGTDGGTDGGTGNAPTVTATVPVNSATGVALNSSISATFSRAMDPSTLGTTTFTVKQGTTTVPGLVTYAAATQTATFAPAAALGSSLVCTATITTGAKDSGGVALAADHIWTFTTAANAAPPTVISTTPLDLATLVSISKRPTATFDKAMNPTTITSLTFTVKQGATLIPGAVTLDGVANTATFTPNAPLGLGLPYTATVTTGAKDTGNTALVADKIWTFTTDPCSQAPVALRSASNFVVLGGSTVTNTGPTSIIGDLGVSPGTAVTGFQPGAIIGTQHAGDPTAAQGIADLTTAYNDAAGRALCAVTKAGNLGGQTLAPGLYTSGTSLAISSGDLTLDAGGDGDAVFIFQMASTLTTTAGRQVILAGGAKSANIFWQVGTSATLGTTSAFQGTIMADQAVTLNTGATLNGRALARIAAVSLDSNTIVKPTP
jgi:Ice-binding-like/Bacterial Ig-like domain